MKTMKYILDIFQLILSKLSLTFFSAVVIIFCQFANSEPPVSKWAVDRKVFFTQAFENLGFYMMAVESELSLTPEQAQAFYDIGNVAHDRVRKKLWNEPHFEMEFSANNEDFIIPGVKIRSAVVVDIGDPLSKILVNLNHIQRPDPNSDLETDLPGAVQIFIHEFAHKTKHSAKPYVDQMAAKVATSLRNHFREFEIEPGYKIYVLGLENPFINFYNKLVARKTDQTQILTEVYMFAQLMYPGAEVGVFEQRGTQITLRPEIQNYIRSSIGYYNTGSTSSTSHTPLTMAMVHNISKEHVGDRFPTIKINLAIKQMMVGIVNNQAVRPRVLNDLALQMTANSIYSEIVLYTGRTGIKKFSVRKYDSQLMAENAEVNQFEYRNGNIEGRGVIQLDSDDVIHLQKVGAQYSVFLKFKSGQILVPAQVTKSTRNQIEFKFKLKCSPAEGPVIVDLLQIRTNERTLDVPIKEVKKISFAQKKSATFEVVAWKITDSKGEKWITPRGNVAPLIEGDPNNINIFADFGFLIRSDTPIAELVFNFRMADQIYNPDGQVNFSRLSEVSHRIGAESLVQEKSGPYYKVFVKAGLTVSPTVYIEEKDKLKKTLAIEPQFRLVLSKTRITNESLQVIGFDDPIISMVLNPKRDLKLGLRAELRSCRKVLGQGKKTNK
jgi:hypothetical protein